MVAPNSTAPLPISGRRWSIATSFSLMRPGKQCKHIGEADRREGREAEIDRR